jgi:hypothetical protein
MPSVLLATGGLDFSLKVRGARVTSSAAATAAAAAAAAADADADAADDDDDDADATRCCHSRS